VYAGIGIQYPGHFAVSCPIVGGGYVDAGSDEVLLHQFGGIAPGDLFEFEGAVFLGIDFNSTFAPSKRDIDDRTLVGHQAGQGHYLILIYFRGEADTPFARKFVMRMLDPICFDDLDVPIVHLYGETHSVNGVTGLDLLQYPGIPGGKLSSFIKTFFYAFEK